VSEGVEKTTSASDRAGRPTTTTQRGTGDLALDFVNTVEWRGREGPDRGEHLVSYDALLAWAEGAGVLTTAHTAALAAAARARPADAEAALGSALALRDALARLLPVETRHQAGPDALATVNAVLVDAVSAPRLVPEDGHFRLAWPVPDTRLDAPTWPVARATVDLLTSAEERWVRACADPECGWLFFDESRGHRRRWCSMETCGNRAKARRHYARARSRGRADAG
jgi:predicted RNA-binding Zn ribbon-like protein